MKILATLIVTLGFINLVVAQQPLGEEDHYKYWRMRSRLRNHFVAVGYEKGANVNSTTSIYGIPADSKRLVEDPIDRRNSTDSTFEPTNTESDPKTSYDLKWGDGPEQLAWYLGVLATEYRL
jgi:hypothetical protein